MTDINFGSTYRIPISQPGINAAKKEKLRTLVLSYPNNLIGKGKQGNARVSVPDSEDANFIRKLKGIGYKIFQIFEGENVPKHKIDKLIKEKIAANDFRQKGKNPERLSKEVKEKRRYERRLTLPEIEEEVEDTVVKAAEPVMKTKKSMPVEDKVPFFESMDLPTPDEIRKSSSYLRLVEESGKEFAEAVFFGIKK